MIIPAGFARLACLAAFVAFISAAPAFTQTVAHVYVQVQHDNGNSTAVTLYDTATNGHLTKVGTYPLYARSTLIGSNGVYLFASGNDDPNYYGQTNVDSYPVKSNGAIGLRSETINTLEYSGGCSSGDVQIESTKLDHSGHYLFVRIYDPLYGTCDQWQTYHIANNGALTFLGREEGSGMGYLETINSNNAFAYGSREGALCAGPNSTLSQFFAYSRLSDHVLAQNHNFAATGPRSAPSTLDTLWVSADPTDHLAVLMNDCNSTNGLPARVVSYTINSTTGAIVSTDIWSSTAATAVNTQIPPNSLPPMSTSMSPSGKLVAVVGGGFQVFHFNGGSLVTTYTGLKHGTDYMGHPAWDKYNHFYVLDGAQLRIYTITPSAFSEAPGSPVAVNGGGLVVVSN